MKKISFFNEKGGTGKTLYNMLFAAWLCFDKGRKVYAVDFDFPSYQFFKTREYELGLMQENEDFAKMVTSAPYPLTKVEGKEHYTAEQLQRIIMDIRKMDQKEGFYIMDFPGRFTPGCPAHAIATAGLLDCIIFPIDSDRQSRASAMLINSIVNNPKVLERNGKEHQDVLAMWNRETRNERIGKRDFYKDTEEMFEFLGIPICKTRGRELLSFRRDGETFGFVRSTVCYPKTNIMRAAPWLEDIFNEILLRIEGEPQEKQTKKENE